MQAHPPHGLTRRNAIQAGAIGLLGFGANHLAALQAHGGEAAVRKPVGPVARARSVVYIFLSGGLAQHESFDMKPDAPLEFRGEFKPISTSADGVQICEHLPGLARLAHKYALVRSLTHPSNDHSGAHHIMLTGRSELPLGFDRSKPKATDWPGIVALAGSMLPVRHNLPPALVLPDKLQHREGRLIPGQFAGQLGKSRDPWFLEMSPYHPAHYGAYPEYLFHHEKGALSDESLVFQAPHLSLPQGLTNDRLLDRLSLRGSIEAQSRRLAESIEDTAFDRYREAAVSLLTDQSVRQAFDIEKAPLATRERYGLNSFGWSLLMARQLLENGVRLIQVNLGNNESWDTHQAAFPNLKNFLLPPMDKAVSAFLEDLDASGLLSDTLVVLGSEFGRTPKISTLPGAKLPGRDHWGATQTVLLAGAGVRGGTVIGATDSRGAYPVSDPQRPENLAATIYQALGIPHTMEWHDPLERPHMLYQGEPIKGLT
jgi:hypothetical protein